MGNEEQLDEFLAKFDELVSDLSVDEVPEVPDINGNDVLNLTSDDSWEEKTKVRDFLKTLEEVHFPGGTIQYSKITQTMFQKHRQFDGVENISQRLLTITEKYHCDLLKDDILKKRFYKLIDHIQLASFQLSEMSEKYKEETAELIEKIDKSQSKLN